MGCDVNKHFRAASYLVISHTIMERWRGRVALVTGASEGIGAAIALRLATLGMQVVGVARSHHKIEEWSREAGVTVHAVHCDVSKEEDVRAAVHWARNNLGGVDVLVNNAGVVPAVNLIDAPTEDMCKMLDVNVLGLSVCTREVIKDMRERGVDDGHIFHINSDCGHFIVDAPGFHFYTATKHAVRVLTEGLRRELRDLSTKIRVTSVSPGLVRTKIFTNNGYGQENSDKFFEDCPYLEPADIAGAVEYALAAPSHVQVHEILIRPTGDTY